MAEDISTPEVESSKKNRRLVQSDLGFTEAVRTARTTKNSRSFDPPVKRCLTVWFVVAMGGNG